MAQPLAGIVFQRTDSVNGIAAATTQALEDGRLLKGRAPQVQDWLTAWAESTERVSFRKQCRLSGKRTGRHLTANLRQVRRKQLKVMAEDRRRRLREMLRRAQFISLSTVSAAMLHGSLMCIEESSV